jgi:hypothetical protein
MWKCENKIFFFKNTFPRLSRKAVKPRADNRESTVFIFALKHNFMVTYGEWSYGSTFWSLVRAKDDEPLASAALPARKIPQPSTEYETGCASEAARRGHWRETCQKGRDGYMTSNPEDIVLFMLQALGTSNQFTDRLRVK